MKSRWESMGASRGLFQAGPDRENTLYVWAVVSGPLREKDHTYILHVACSVKLNRRTESLVVFFPNPLLDL